MAYFLIQFDIRYFLKKIGVRLEKNIIDRRFLSVFGLFYWHRLVLRLCLNYVSSSSNFLFGNAPLKTKLLVNEKI